LCGYIRPFGGYQVVPVLPGGEVRVVGVPGPVVVPEGVVTEPRIVQTHLSTGFTSPPFQVGKLFLFVADVPAEQLIVVNHFNPNLTFTGKAMNTA